METALKLKLMLLYWLKRRRERREELFLARRQRHASRRTGARDFQRFLTDVLDNEEKCLAYIRMTPATFRLLLEKVGPHIEKRLTNFRQPVSPKERLVMTLRYLATGESYVSLASHFHAGVSTLRGIIKDTCQAIWRVLNPEVMPRPTKELWQQIADDFSAKANFPHCIGVVDGKHIRIKKPSNSDDRFYNHARFYSIVLLAVVDASGKFVIIEAGTSGSEASDGGIFTHSALGDRLLHGSIENLPEPAVLPGTSSDTKLPFAFVGCEGFPLREGIMRPFFHRQLTPERKVFNDRLSLVRRSAEYSFERLSQTWSILLRPLEESPETATVIVKAIVILHNFILIQERLDGLTSEQNKQELPGKATMQGLETLKGFRATKSAKQNREMLTWYVVDHP